jgi:hypothetical protein
VPNRSRAPNVLVSILGFVVLGPIALGVVVAVGSGQLDSILIILAGWWGLGVAAGPIGWLVTLIPTILGAVLYWLVLNSVLRLFPRSGVNRVSLGLTSAAAGGLVAVAAWALLKLVLTGATRGPFPTIFLLPTGILVGLILGWLAKVERPNSTPHTDARASTALDQPPSARAGERGR